MYQTILTLLLFNFCLADWLQISTSFTNDYSYGWSFCRSSYTYKNCPNSLLQYTYLNNYYYCFYQPFYYSGFQYQLVFDIYFDNANSENFTNMTVDFYDLYKNTQNNIYKKSYITTDLTQQSNRICKQGVDYAFNFETVVADIIITTYFFRYWFQLNPYDSGNQVGIRNILIYTKACFPKCRTCSGEAENQCLTCQYGSPNFGKCGSDPQCKFSKQGDVNCKSECDRDYYITNSKFICVPDRRITNYITINFYNNYLYSSTPKCEPVFINDTLNSNLKNIKSIYDSTTGTYYLGTFNFNEGVSFQLDPNNLMKFIRLRLTFLLSNFKAESMINIYQNNILQSVVRYPSTGNYNAIQLYEGSLYSFKIYKIETIFRTLSPNPLISVQGQLLTQSEHWGLQYLYIDIGKCKENCLICLNFDICQQCNLNYRLYQNECILQCPIHSQNCIDYSDEYLYSRYLAKGFYNINMTLDQVQSFYDSVTNEATNFKSGQKFGFFPNKFVLGGMMVWYDASYIKTYTITQPHYAVSIRFNFTFGDQYPGNFYYIINSIARGPYNLSRQATNMSTKYQLYNYTGKSQYENMTNFYEFLNPYTDNTLDLELKCVAPDSFDIRDGFCAISEYFIVVHYCPPFCTQCTSVNQNDCIVWETGYSSSTCDSGKYLAFDSSTETYSCITCQDGCQTCDSLEECTSCKSQFTLMNGLCQCPPFRYKNGNSCSKCNKYCEQCYDGTSSNCLTCVQSLHRYIKNNQCQCQPGYQEDGKNLPCKPICGDKLIVQGEDCDDGNFNPFDGCDQCKFSCLQYCDLCIFGICQGCQIGYQLIQNNCFPICDNTQIILKHQCDIINYCTSHCIDCQFGICYKCNEQIGWYLQDNGNCSPICGDLIVTKPYEECDDGNEIPNDGCDLCLFSCDFNCEMCHYGYCSMCSNGYQLTPKTNQCIPICGDFIIGLKELCDDNTSQYDGCYNCHMNCQPACTQCSLKGCLECNTPGWQYDPIDRNCKTICGDGLIMVDEECDDAISDNCRNCRYECWDSCMLCVQGYCVQCQAGWFLNIDFECHPISGDGIVLGLEQCDDLNFRNEGGCFFSNYTCQLICDLCFYGKCQICKEGYYNSNGICIEINNDGIIAGNEQCDDGNIIPYDGCYDSQFDCPQFCLICIQGFCIICDDSTGYGYLDIQTNLCLMIPYDLAGFQDENCNSLYSLLMDIQYCTQDCPPQCQYCRAGHCQKCNYGYYLDKQINKCNSKCGDKIIVGDEKCDDANQDLTDSCSNCQLSCDEHCVKCVNGKCLQCRGIGWTLNLTTMRCETICGDGITTGNEQCDDGNYEPEDGCYNCLFECQKSCISCLKGTCISCEVGWQPAKKEDECEPKCGDKLIIPIYEDCDDGNEFPFDGCFKCKYSCQDECGDCRKGVCYECDAQGWELLNHYCYPKCGDGYVVEGFEECDDGNNIQFDGCYNCNYQCEEQCISCKQGVCYDCNSTAGYIIEINKCVPRCGDNRVVGTEQCDDGNEEDNDGCFECQFKCDVFCEICKDGICVQCQYGRQVNERTNKCLTFCGDGITVLDEENCDDGNDDNGDGCNKVCVVEKNWACNSTEGTLSKCGYTKLPEIILTLSNSLPTTEQIVTLSFSQQMKRSKTSSSNLSEYIATNITNMNIKDYLVSVQQGDQIRDDFATDVYFQLIIYLYASVPQPLLCISIENNSLISEFNLTLLNSTSSILLVTPTILSSSQKNFALSAQKFNKGVIYALVGLSSLCVATGSSDPFWNLMDQLQYLSYIKYINIEFPNNLNIYFEVFKLVSISPLIKFLRIDEFFAMLDGEDDYFIATQNKFEYDEINAYFFQNFQSFLFFVMGGIVIYWMSKYIHLILYNIRPKYLCRFNFTVSNMLFKLRKSTKKQYKYFFYNGILRIIMSNWYDLSFACAIQLANYQSSNIVLQINYAMAVIIFISQFLITIIIASVITQFFRNNTISRRKKQYDTLFEEIRNGRNFWVMQYNTLSLIKKQLFISLMVFMQNQGELQALCIALLQTIYLCYLIFTKPLKKKFEYYKSIVTETLIIFNSLTFLAYAYQQELQLNQDQQLNLGWLHIFTSTSILGVSLFYDFIDQGNIIIKKLCKIKKPINDGPRRPDKEYFDKLDIFF